MSNGNKSAFPLTYEMFCSGPKGNVHLGLTKRELIAALERIDDGDIPSPEARKGMGWPEHPRATPGHDVTPADSYLYYVELWARIRVLKADALLNALSEGNSRNV